MQRKFLISTYVFIILLSLIGLFWSAKQDEGVFLTIAHFWGNGQIPYKDFFDHKPPGIYILLFPIAKIFTQIFTARMVIIFVNLLSSIFIYKIICQKLSKKQAIFPSIIFFWMMYIFQGFLIETEPLMAFALIVSYYFFIKSKNNLRYIILVGLFSGVAFLFKQPAAINILVYSLFYFIKKNHHKIKLTKIALYVFGIFISILPVCLYFIPKVGIENLYYQIFVSNFTYPSLKNNQIIAPLIFSLPIIFLTLLQIDKKIKQTKWSDQDFLLIFFILFPLPLLIFRTYPHYWLQIVPFLIIFIAESINTYQKILFLPIFFSVLFFGYQFVNYEFPIYHEQSQISQYVKHEAKKSDYIYSTRNLSSIYFQTGNQPSSEYLYINEISRNDLSEEKTIQSIQKNPPKIIIWIDPEKYYLEPYAWTLSLYIQSNYCVIKKYAHSNLVIYQLPNDNCRIAKPLPVRIK